MRRVRRELLEHVVVLNARHLHARETWRHFAPTIRAVTSSARQLDDTPPLHVRAVAAIADVDATAWDACAGADNPFVRHAFLSALEESRSACPDEGWTPLHLLVEDARGALVGAMPLYAKAHSYGEYVFDQAWAGALERAGGRYYPKLLCAIPFSPVPGPRLLVRPDQHRATVEGALVDASVELARRLDISSIHINFLGEEPWQRLGGQGFLLRTDVQFHFENRGYDTFDAFLGALTARKRKAIKRERQELRDAGLTFRTLSGTAIEPRHWDAFYRFYRDTTDRKWGQAYLTRDFFSSLGRTLGDAIVLVLAEHRGELVAGALNLRGGDTLYGRNWGAVARFRFLHFEVCYYQAIEYAIAHGLSTVQAGVQGEHKLQRGYLPVVTRSAHWIGEPRLRKAVAQHLAYERAAVAQELETLRAASPFRSD